MTRAPTPSGARLHGQTRDKENWQWNCLQSANDDAHSCDTPRLV